LFKLPILKPSSLPTVVATVLGLMLLGLGAWEMRAEFARAAELQQALHRSYETRSQIQSVFSFVQDAETGQRGYVITGQPAFLEPYEGARAEAARRLETLAGFFAGSPAQAARLGKLRTGVDAKFEDLERSITVRRRDGADAAVSIVSTGRGRRLMDDIRLIEREMIQAEAQNLDATMRVGLATTRRAERLMEILFAVLLIAVITSLWIARRQSALRRDLLIDRDRHIARQQAIFDSTLDAIITLEPDGRIGSANRAAERMFGYSVAELRGGDLALLLDSQDGSSLPTDLRERSGLSEGVVQELTAHRRTGETLAVDVALSEMRLADGRHVVAAIRDISERKRIGKMKDEFVSTVSHELRTPLTSIAGSLGLLKGGAAGAIPDTAARLIAIASSNAERLVRLINDILDIEKMEAGELAFAPAPTELRALVQKSLDGVSGYAEQLKVALSLEPGEDCTVEGDPDRLVQVVTNIVSNAAKFSPTGGRVEVRISAEGGTARVAVRDDGPGVQDAFRDRIFTKFAQADSSHTRQKGGTGLGLAIAREIVERHGGRLHFLSEAGQGATFFIDLPLSEKRAEPEAGALPQRELMEGAASARPFILHVEDDEDVGEVVAGGLGGGGGGGAGGVDRRSAGRAGEPPP
jgi:PAS domain S-box-containing protein